MDLEQAVGDLTPRLLRYCTARTGNAALSEDIAHDTLVALVQRWRRSGPPESPEAFVFAIARRRAIRAVLRQRLLVPIAFLTNRQDEHRDPEHLAIGKNQRDVTLAAIARLPSRDREALLLVAVAQLDTAAASKLLGISETAFKVRTFRARRRLAALMEYGNVESRGRL
jgi:RNA polymerase sigma factor (sigma-70 family)